MTSEKEVRGRLVLESGIVTGRIRIEGDLIVSVDLEGEPEGSGAQLPLIGPGFVDVHVHGWGGHDAMGTTDDLDGMARALLRRGSRRSCPLR